MKDKLDDFLTEAARSLTKRLMAEQYPLEKKQFFTSAPSIQHQIIHALIDQLETRSAYADTASVLLASETERVAFAKLVGERVYKALYEAHDGLA